MSEYSARPLSFAQMEEHINGRRHLHFLRKTSLSHCMYERRANTALTSSTKPAPWLRAHHAYGVTQYSAGIITAVTDQSIIISY